MPVMGRQDINLGRHGHKSVMLADILVKHFLFLLLRFSNLNYIAIQVNLFPFLPSGKKSKSHHWRWSPSDVLRKKSFSLKAFNKQGILLSFDSKHQSALWLMTNENTSTAEVSSIHICTLPTGFKVYFF